MFKAGASTFILAAAVSTAVTLGALAELTFAAPTFDVPAVDPSEKFPGGAATSKASVDTTNAFSASSATIPFERELDFKIGNAIFRKFWVSAPSSTKTSDGLGPLYNARSCQGCHLKDGRGHPPDPKDADDQAVSMLMRLSIPPETAEQKQRLAEKKINAIPEPTYGGQLQPFGVQGIAAEGHIHISYKDKPVTLADGTVITLRDPTYAINAPAYGPLSPSVMMSPRVAPPMIGLGLIEAVPDAQILERADAADKDGDGISGRENRARPATGGSTALGRFGWKASNPTIAIQSADAFANDIGIGSRLVPHAFGDCTAAQTACNGAPSGAPPATPGIEIADDLMRLVAFYSANLAVPPRRNADDAVVLKGRRLFYETGCAACHRPSLKTAVSDDQPHLSNLTIWPYTDVLLHDMGDALADNRPDGDADGREWRTPPLWGIGLTETVSGHTYLLHDGRARGVLEAVLWHGGEAQAARDRVTHLSKDERDALVAFVNSL